MKVTMNKKKTRVLLQLESSRLHLESVITVSPPLMQEKLLQPKLQDYQVFSPTVVNLCPNERRPLPEQNHPMRNPAPAQKRNNPGKKVFIGPRPKLKKRLTCFEPWSCQPRT